MSLIDEIAKKIEPLEKKINLAWWDLSTTGEQKYAEAFKEAKIALKKLFSSSELYSKLKNENEPGREREKKLLLNGFIENQIPQELIEQIVTLEAEIESLYTNFRPEVDGTHLSNNDLKKVLAESTDLSFREKVWKASKEIGSQVEEPVLKLVELRNLAAQKVGYPDFYSMQLDLQELDQHSLFSLLEQLKEKTDPLWEVYKGELDVKISRELGVEKLFPWHYGDPFFQEAPKQGHLDSLYAGKDIVGISRQFFSTISLDVDDILERSDLFEREGKNQHAFCTCIDRKEDVRILCNIRDNEYWMGTQLHELGHAVYDKFIDPALPFLLRTVPHTSTTEAIAMIFGRLSSDPEFMNRFVEKGAGQKSDQAAQNLLVFSRWVLVMVYFERDLYQGKNLKLNQQWWHYVEKFQWINPPPERDQPDWAAKLHLACAPVYYQNYILGEMTASQLKTFAPSLLTVEGGAYLKERLFSLGAKYPWDKTIEKATGEKLNPIYFVKDLTLKRAPLS